MTPTSGYALLPVIAAGIGGPVLVAAGGLVVVLAILLVFVMVLRSNGDARKTSSGIGYDAHQGPYGQSRAPASQPNRGQRPAPPWADEYNDQRGPASRPPSGADWGYGPPSAPGAGAAASANAGRGGANWGTPSGAGWGEQAAAAPQWGGQMGQMDSPNSPNSPNQAPQWGGPPAAQGPVARNDWSQQPDPQQGWNAPPTTPRGWEQPAGQQVGGQNWGGPASPVPPSRPDRAPSAPAYGRQDYATNNFNDNNYATNNFNDGGYGDEQRTHVARPMSNQSEPKLVVSEGKEPGRNYDLRKDRITIGRSRESDVFLEDLAVSRTHTTINHQPDGRYLLRDENSANGTMVNGQRVSDHMLEDGDKIQVGQTLLVFVYR